MLNTREKKSLIVDEPVYLRIETVVSIVNDEPKIVKRNPRFQRLVQVTSR